jgi:glycosyltransferase involved in cell wall biosynthesis
MGEDLHVAAITAGYNAPAARFRVAQFLQPLEKYGIDMQWMPAIVAKHPPIRRWLRPFWAPAAIAGRIPGTLATWQADITLLLREMVSTLITLEPFTKRPRVLDVDDAIWLHRGGGFARYLAQHVDRIIVGNEFLADWFSQYHNDIVILPTAVDTERFFPLNVSPYSDISVIGWSGTSGNLRYLYAIEPALDKVLRSRQNVELHIVSDRAPRFRKLPEQKIKYTQWSIENEVSTIQNMDIGIMPLDDTDWTRGKCSYKMLLYMACGLPVVVSPVGMNTKILDEDQVGLGAKTFQDWADAIIYMLDHQEKRQYMGERGRSLVERQYSIRVLTPYFAGYLKDMICVE